MQASGSDGLTGLVSEPAIATTLSTDTPLPDLGARRINQAKANGAPDNVTVVLLRYDDWQIG
jgi:serine/threonine protein phosphatase PrpC